MIRDPQPRVTCSICHFTAPLAYITHFSEGRPLCPICYSELDVIESPADVPLVVTVPAAEAFACLTK